jgi:hypothetical protein
MRTHSSAWSPRPTIAHDHIAGNLERVLNSRLERYDPSLLAMRLQPQEGSIFSLYG